MMKSNDDYLKAVWRTEKILVGADNDQDARNTFSKNIRGCCAQGRFI